MTRRGGSSDRASGPEEPLALTESSINTSWQSSSSMGISNFNEPLDVSLDL